MNAQLTLSAQLDPSTIISLHHGKPVTTSLMVAEVFGKQHKNVIQKIESLDCPAEFMSANFSAHEEIIQAGAVKRASKFYEMTKDGFMLLVMGFTGKPAMATKIAFINAFNWMAEQLITKTPKPLAIDYPASLLISTNPQIDRTQIQYGKGNLLITAGMVCGEHRSPTRKLLNELRNAGYDINGCWIEVQAMKYHLETLLSQVSDMQRRVESIGSRGMRVSIDECASLPLLK